MIEVGRLCVKLAGRDAGRTCVVIDVVDERTVLIDGDVRRRNCNLTHLEPLAGKVDLKKGASHADVVKAFEKLNLSAWSTKPKNAGERPLKFRKSNVKVTPESSAKPTPSKAIEPKAEEKPTLKKEAKPEPKAASAEKKEVKPTPKAESKPEAKSVSVEKPKTAPAKPAEKKKVSDFGAE